MMNRYRTTLFAGLLAFGVAACGDDVQVVEAPPTPDPALNVSVTPQNQTIQEGGTAEFAVNVSGGQPGATASISCSTNNSSVATASTSGNTCVVQGVGPGNTTVNVSVTKGEGDRQQTSTAGASIQVGAIVSATVAIGNITQGGAAIQVNNVTGQIEVQLDIQRGDQNVNAAHLLIDGEVVTSQSMGPAPSSSEAEGGDTPAEVVEHVTLIYETDGWEEGEDGLPVVNHVNGPRVIGARVTGPNMSPVDATNTTTLTFNNEDEILVVRRDGGQGIVGQGVRYWGGEDIEFQVLPVLFSGGAAGELEVSGVTTGATANAGFEDVDLGAGSGAVETLQSPFLFTAAYGDNQNEVEDAPGADGHIISVGNIWDDEGVFLAGLSGVFDLQNLFLDFTGPDLTGPIQLGGQAIALEYYSAGVFDIVDAVDLGVGISGSADMRSAWQVTDLVENEELLDIFRVEDEGLPEGSDPAGKYEIDLLGYWDRLGNEADVSGIATSVAFNVDKTAPVFSEASELGPEFVFKGDAEDGGPDWRNHIRFRLNDPDLADGTDGSGVDDAAVWYLLENLDEGTDFGDFGSASFGSVGFDGPDSWRSHPEAAGLGDGLSRLTVTAFDNAIPANESEWVFEFILDTTPPDVTLTSTPSNVSTSASSTDFTVAGELSDANGVSPDLSLVEVRFPEDNDPTTLTTCATGLDYALAGDLYSSAGGAGQLNRNAIEIDEAFSETFRAFNPGGNVSYRYCVWVSGADVALDAFGDPDPNVARELIVLDVTWNP